MGPLISSEFCVNFSEVCPKYNIIGIRTPFVDFFSMLAGCRFFTVAKTVVSVLFPFAWI